MAQENQNLTYWQYTDGQLDTGIVRRVNNRLKDEKKIRLYWLDEDVRDISELYLLPYKPLAFLVEKGDTIMIRRELEGSSKLLQKIHDGEVVLYRELSGRKSRRYYLEQDGVYHPIHYRVTRELLADNFLMAKREFNVPRKVKNNYQAIEFVHQYSNMATTGAKTVPNRNYFLGRNRIGIAYDLGIPIEKLGTQAPSNSSWIRSYTIQHPALSVSYERQVNKRFPWLYGQLQARLFRLNTEREWRIGATTSSSGEPNISEQLKITNLYAYPGILFEFMQGYRLRPLIGGGATIALPMQFYRHITAIDVPGYPYQQTVENLQYYSFGYYMEIGWRINFSRNLVLGFSLRREDLSQERNTEDVNILDTMLLPNRPELATRRQIQTQLQLQYSW